MHLGLGFFLFVCLFVCMLIQKCRNCYICMLNVCLRTDQNPLFPLIKHCYITFCFKIPTQLIVQKPDSDRGQQEFAGRDPEVDLRNLDLGRSK
jgi:hypothetical protein